MSLFTLNDSNIYRLYKAIAYLREAALVSSSNTSSYSYGSTTTMMLDIHRLIQEAVIHSLGENLLDYFNAVIFLLFAVFDQIQLENVPENDEWRLYSQLLSHIFSMVHRY